MVGLGLSEFTFDNTMKPPSKVKRWNHSSKMLVVLGVFAAMFGVRGMPSFHFSETWRPTHERWRGQTNEEVRAMMWKQFLCCIGQRRRVGMVVWMGLCFFPKEGWCSPPTSKPITASKDTRFRACKIVILSYFSNRRWEDAKWMLSECLRVVEEKEHQSDLWFLRGVLAKRIQRLSLAFFFTGERSR